MEKVNQEEYYSAIASIGDNGFYTNVDGRGTSMRHDYSYSDYSAEKPSLVLPRTQRDIILTMDEVYENFGLIKQIIDLMADFVIQGIRIVHPRPNIQEFYENWFNRVDGLHVSDRIATGLFKHGTCIVRRKYASLNKKLERDIKTARADLEPLEIPRRSIPCRYSFLNPAVVDVVGGSISSFVSGNKIYGIVLPETIKSMILNPSTTEEASAINALPEEIRAAARKDGIFPLSVNDTIVLHYKKDDWKNWAKPIIYSILKNVFLLEKMQLADFSALDGAIDRVRIIKLGDLEHQLVPNSDAFAKLRDALQGNVGAGVRTILWGPDIKMEESQTDIHQFLGDDKYKPALNGIYGGMGIPPTLTGSENSGGGTTNNLVSLKALVKRLDYVRNQVVRFWTRELTILKKILGHNQNAEIEFDIANFGDEEAEKKLWIDLADRNIISHEALQVRFGAKPEVEEARMQRAEKMRSSKRRAPKAGPWHNPEWERMAQKSLLDKGVVDPSQIGVRLEEKGDDDLNEVGVTAPTPKTEPAPKLDNPGGRPANTKDSLPRKRRLFKTQVRATKIWADDCHAALDDLINPFILNQFKKKNMRSLSKEEILLSERLKLSAFFGLKLNQEIDPSVLKSLNNDMYEEYLKSVSSIESELNKKLTLEEKRDIASDMLVEKFYVM